MDTETVVLAAASAVVAVAQIGILVLGRPSGLREWVFAALPTAGLAALLLLAWRSLG